MRPSKQELQFALSDFIRLIKKRKTSVFFWIFSGAMICFLLAVTRPVSYLVHASFRDKGKTEATIRSSLSDLLFSTSNVKDSEAASNMKSNKLIGQTIGKLHAQGQITKSSQANPLLQLGLDNLLAEWAYWNSLKVPVLNELEPSLRLTDVVYKGETELQLKLIFEDQAHFTIIDAQKQLFGKGEINQPVSLLDGVQFTVRLSSEHPKPHDSYTIVLIPLAEVSRAHAAQLWIDLDKDDRTLLKLQFRHRDRHFAAQFLNKLMESYQKRLEEEHDLISNTQVNYLQRRQEEVGNKVEELMHNFVLKASEDMSASGFTSLQKEMDFLASNLALNQQKLTEIELEIDRLQAIDCDSCVHFETYRDNSDVIPNKLLEEIRLLQVQGDSLKLALQKLGLGSNSKAKIEDDFQSVEKLASQMQQTERIVLAIKNDQVEPLVLTNIEPPVEDWYSNYKAKQTAVLLASDTSKSVLEQDFKQFKNYFLTYLEAFQRLLNIRYHTLTQQISAPQIDAKELEGMTLETSKGLYTSYIQEIHELEAQEKQHRFLVEQMQKPDFEISSVAAILTDPVSIERLNKTTQLVINLKDENNHTSRELGRLQEEVALQKSFLTSHIQQMAELLNIKLKLLNEKLISLQVLMLDLTQQQIALTKKYFANYIESRIGNLNQEKSALQEHQTRLHARMATIPPQWAAEQLLNHNLALHQRFLENLSNMVESKNITKNLEMIQSAPLDRAIAPLNPKPPRLVFFTLLGSLLGFLGASCFLFTKTMIKGVPASYDNLRLADFHISGFMTHFQGDELSATMPLLNSDLDTLRRLIAHYETNSQLKESKELLIINGKGHDFSNTLAKLLSKKGLRTLKLQLGFDKAQSEPGLLQYLEGKSDFPLIQHLDGFDLINAGGASRYSEELLRSHRFVNLLNSLKSSYDWIIGVTPVSIPSAEAENLAKLFTGCAIIVTDETLPNLIAFNSTLDEKHQKAVTFIFMSS